MEQADINDLEELIDQWGLDVVLAVITDLCYVKAAHVESVWHNRVVAGQWRDAAKRIECTTLISR